MPAEMEPSSAVDDVENLLLSASLRSADRPGPKRITRCSSRSQPLAASKATRTVAVSSPSRRGSRSFSSTTKLVAVAIGATSFVVDENDLEPLRDGDDTANCPRRFRCRRRLGAGLEQRVIRFGPGGRRRLAGTGGSLHRRRPRTAPPRRAPHELEPKMGVYLAPGEVLCRRAPRRMEPCACSPVLAPGGPCGGPASAR